MLDFNSFLFLLESGAASPGALGAIAGSVATVVVILSSRYCLASRKAQERIVKNWKEKMREAQEKEDEDAVRMHDMAATYARDLRFAATNVLMQGIQAQLQLGQSLLKEVRSYLAKAPTQERKEAIVHQLTNLKEAMHH